MKAIIQRTLGCKLEIQNELINKIEKGLVIFLGVQKGDTKKDIDILCEKILNLRVFEDESQKMNLSLKDILCEIMVISNFTICSSTKHGRRPSFENAELPEVAQELYKNFCKKMGEIYNPSKIKQGKFGSYMKITIINDGPVNIIIESLNGKII